MLLAALIDAGAPLETVSNAVSTVPADSVDLVATVVSRAGLRATKIDVVSVAQDQPDRSWADIRTLLAQADLPDLIREVYHTLSTIGEEPAESSKPKAAVPPTKSVFADYIVCLEDGKKMKMLKRHLMTDHKLTPDQYIRSTRLREWARRNKNSKYIPEALLEAWGFEIESTL